MGYGASARCLLGNHDLHLLAVDVGARKPSRKDTLDTVLQAPDKPALLDWLRQQRLAMRETIGGKGLLMVHAGVLPTWSATKTIALSKEVETVLRAPDYADFLHQMYGNGPDAWSDALQGADRLRVIVNALTRLRFCTPDGTMEFKNTGAADTAPPGYLPWFDVPGRKTRNVTMAFGHWSTLGWLGRSDVLALDTGCVWGGCLSALRVSAAGKDLPWQTELLQVHCPQAQKPGE